MRGKASCYLYNGFRCDVEDAILLATIKTNYGSANRRGQGAIGKPLVAPAGAIPPATRKDQHRENKSFPILVGRAHLARQYVSGRMCSWGALLRERKVTGRDASLPAPLLSAFGILVARGTVGALPQTPQGTLSLDPARGDPPLTPPRD